MWVFFDVLAACCLDLFEKLDIFDTFDCLDLAEFLLAAEFLDLADRCDAAERFERILDPLKLEDSFDSSFTLFVVFEDSLEASSKILID